MMAGYIVSEEFHDANGMIDRVIIHRVMEPNNGMYLRRDDGSQISAEDLRELIRDGNDVRNEDTRQRYILEDDQIIIRVEIK